jgi:hypothetical protein
MRSKPKESRPIGKRHGIMPSKGDIPESENRRHGEQNFIPGNNPNVIRYELIRLRDTLDIRIRIQIERIHNRFTPIFREWVIPIPDIEDIQTGTNPSGTVVPKI